MQKYGVNELRRMFLEFFESKGHLAMKSFSLVPHNDKSLLLINSGMAPLKPYFTGQEIPPRRRYALQGYLPVLSYLSTQQVGVALYHPRTKLFGKLPKQSPPNNHFIQSGKV